MDTYRKTHNDFFLACAYLRHAYGLAVVDFVDVTAGRWLTEGQIEDFTVAYMMGAEL